jgi:hypothetical protein
MPSPTRRAALIARTMSALVVVIAVAAAASGAAAAGSGRATGDLRLVGEPVILDANIGQGSGEALEHFYAVIRVKNTFRDTQNVTVEFTVRQGPATKIRTVTAGIRPGGGVIISDVVLQKKGTRTVEVRFKSFGASHADKALVAAKIVGTPRFVQDQGFGGCSMSARLMNPSTEPLSDAEIYLIALKGGKVVAAGYSHQFDDVKPGATVPVKVDFVTCMKVGAVMAYVEGDGIF